MMKRLIAGIAVVGILWLLSAAAVAQEGTGGTRSVFHVGAGARGIALGGAFSSIGDDASVLFYNPAALRLNQRLNVLVSHLPLFSGFSDASYEYLGLVYPTVSAGAFGFGIMTIGTGDIRGFDEFSRETESLTYRESQAILGYAFDLPWRYIGAVTAGTSVKILSQRVGDFSDTGTGLDLGFIYRPRWIRGVTIGCNLQDAIGAETKLVAVSDKVYRTIMIGAGYTRVFANGSSLALALQMDMPELDENEFRVGAEYTIKQLASFRVGFDAEKITAGIGIAWHGFGVDYGYFSRDDAGSSHPLSLSARIGLSIEEKIALREERRRAEEEARIQQMFAKRIAGHIATAEQHRKDGELPKALDELKIAIEYDPTNAAAAETLAVVERAILAGEEERIRSAENAALINQHSRLGLEYYSKDDYALARAEWRSVLELDPSNANAREYLAKTDERLRALADQHRRQALDLERKGQLAAALGEWNIVRSLDPASTEARDASNRINIRLDEMSKDYSATSRRLKTLELFDGAMKSFGEGRYAEASRQLNELLRLDPGNQEARKLLRRTQRRLVPLTDAEKEQVRTLYVEGMKYFTQGEYDKAIEEWQRILDIDPDNESVMKNIGEAQKRLGNGGAEGGRQ